ncbi:hypothetical protein IJJ46_00635 [Candidatus Saccharibacteria bacterium]|nr:hypothetical protein [Candidatus Saccharibacteria bacterium]
MLNDCVNHHYKMQQAGALSTEEEARAQQEQEFDNPLYSKFSWWVILAERETERSVPRRKGNYEPLGSEIISQPQWQIVGYSDLLTHVDDQDGLVFYGEYAEDGQHLIIYSPPLVIKDNNTVHLAIPGGEEIPLWPICQIDGKTRTDTDWYLVRNGQPMFVSEDTRMANTQIEDLNGMFAAPQLELVISEYADVRDYNVELHNLGWDYHMRLTFLIRVNDKTHIAIAEDPDGHGSYTYILRRPCRACDYRAKHLVTAR